MSDTADVTRRRASRLWPVLVAVAMFAAACGSSDGSGFADLATDGSGADQADQDVTPEPDEEPEETPTEEPTEDPTPEPAEEDPTPDPDQGTGVDGTTPEPEVTPDIQPPAGDCVIDISADPTFGTEALAGGFVPDPFEIAITSGGCVDASEQVEATCRGFLAPAPDFRLQWSGSSNLLRFYFLPDDGSSDTTLVVNDPSVTNFCNDDADLGAGIFDPLVEIVDPLEGVYDIWVGSFASDEFVSGTLFITELLDGGPVALGDGGGDRAPINGVDPLLDPFFGEIALDSGFLPDPHEVSLASGGSNEASELAIGCEGRVASAPDYRLIWGGSDTVLRIFFEPDDSLTDTTLVILDPEGNWACDDDTGPGLTPQFDFGSAGGGLYDIWVGTFVGDDFIDGTLYITERQITADDVG